MFQGSASSGSDVGAKDGRIKKFSAVLDLLKEFFDLRLRPRTLSLPCARKVLPEEEGFSRGQADRAGRFICSSITSIKVFVL